MNQQDKGFVKLLAALIGLLVVIAVAIWIISAMISGVAGPEYDRSDQLQTNIERRLQPVGRVVLAGSAEAEADDEADDVAAADDDAVPGEGVYNSACAACHGAGVLEAPVKGDNDAWSALYEAKGLETLVHNAINGINQMPARGGNPDLSDDEIHDSVVYMLLQSDVSVAEAGEEQVAMAEDDTAEDASAEEMDEPAEEEEAAAEAEQATEETATETAETEAVEEEADATPEEEAAEAEEQQVADAGDGYQVPDNIDPAAGQSTYQSACTACHGQGIAGAPRTGDQDAWAERIAQGWDVLADHTLNGIRGMPPKGGRMDLPDDEILRAMAYMVEQAR